MTPQKTCENQTDIHFFISAYLYFINYFGTLSFGKVDQQF